MKNKDKLDFETTLKDHLNASFDMEKFIMSEDLIQRTLQKIQESETDKPESKNEIERKIYKNRNYKLRGLVSAAAAIVLIIACTSVWQSGLIGNKNLGNTETKSLDQPIDDTRMSITESGDAGYTQNDTQNDTTEIYDVTAEAENPSADNAKSDSTFTAPEQSQLSVDMAVFSTLHSIDSFDQVTKFTVTKGDLAVRISDSEAQKVEELYTLLDQYSVESVEVTDMDKWVYKSEIILKDDRAITIYIKESGDIIVTDSTAYNKTVAYNLDKADEFIKKMDEFYSSLY